MADVSVEFAGIRLKNPLMVGAGPATGNFDKCLALMKGGFGGIVTRSSHVQHLNQPRGKPGTQFWNVPMFGKNIQKSVYSLQSSGTGAKRVQTQKSPGIGSCAPVVTLEQWAEEVHKITRAAKDYDCTIIASVGSCGSLMADEEVWAEETRLMTEAGVDAVEVHTSTMPFSEPGRFMSIDPDKYMLVPLRTVKRSTKLPAFQKITTDCCDTIGLSIMSQKAGADGLVPSTRWASMQTDIEHEKKPVQRAPAIGGPWAAPIMTGLVFRLRHADQTLRNIYEGSTERLPNSAPITVPIIASGGVRSGDEVIGYILAGANAAQMVAHVLLEAQVAGRIEQEIRSWMDRKGYRKISDFQGIMRMMEPEESRAQPQPEPVVDASLCTGCQICVKACMEEAISLVDNVAHVDENFCAGCRTCHIVCPAGAISLKE